MRTNKLRSLPFVLYSVWSLVLSLSRTAEQEAFSHVSPSPRRWAFLCQTSESKGGRRLKLTTQLQAGHHLYDHDVTMGTAFMHKSLRTGWTDFDSWQACLNIATATSGIVQPSVWQSSQPDTRAVANWVLSAHFNWSSISEHLHPVCWLQRHLVNKHGNMHNTGNDLRVDT